MLTALSGGSFGKLATRLRVVRTDGSGRPSACCGALARTVLVALVDPAAGLRPDGRGLHDLLAGTPRSPWQTVGAVDGRERS